MDAVTMAMVLLFVPDPAKGIAEMKRVVKPGGMVSAYMWDILGGGAPMEPVHAEFGPTRLAPFMPPSVEISRMDAVRAAWTDAGLEEIESRVITVRRTFKDFEDFWPIATSGPGLGQTIAGLTPEAVVALQERVRPRLPSATDGTVSYAAWANAIKGR